MKTRTHIIKTSLLFLAFYFFSAQSMSLLSNDLNDSKGNKPQSSDFKITHPNGGEKFGIGTDKTITWEGCAAEDEVTLEYSTDSGHDWITITENATDFEHEWKDIPNSLSDQCLIKASLNDSTDDDWVQILGLGTILQVLYNPDGTRLAACGDDGLFIWDFASKDTVLSVRNDSNSLYCLAYSPDGTKIAGGCRDKTIKIWDAFTGEELRSIDQPYNVVSISFSPDGINLASGSFDNTIYIWDVNTGTVARILSGHLGMVQGLGYNSDGSKLASGSWDTTIKIWDAYTGAEISTLSKHKYNVNSIVFSPNDNILASGSEDKTIKIWNSDTGVEIKTLIGHTGTIWKVGYNPEGNRLVSASFDSTIKIWDTQTGAELRTLSAHKGLVLSVCYSRDGNIIVSGSDDGSIIIWNTETTDISDSFFSISKTDAVEETALKSNSSIHPNPFASSTTINYNLENQTAVTINIYNALGEKIRAMDEGYKNPGQHHAMFEANDLPIGMYYYTISIGDKIETGKMILAR